MTETEDTQDKVDWQYHENAFFTFIIKGNVVEVNKKEKYHWGEVRLLFHNWRAYNYNSKQSGYTMKLNIELG